MLAMVYNILVYLIQGNRVHGLSFSPDLPSLTEEPPMRRWTILIAAAVILVGSSERSQAQAALSPERIAALDARLPALLPQYHIAALAVGIIRNGQIVWTRVYGEQGPGTPATA